MSDLQPAEMRDAVALIKAHIAGDMDGVFAIIDHVDMAVLIPTCFELFLEIIDEFGVSREAVSESMGQWQRSEPPT